MVVLDGNCAVACGPGTDCPYIHIFQCMLERTDTITNEVLEPITFVLTYPTVPGYTTPYPTTQYSSSNIIVSEGLETLTAQGNNPMEQSPY